MAQVAVVGPGSVGCFFAAQLTAAGVPTLACARRPFDRYVIESATWPVDAPADVVTDPAAVAGPVDWVLLTVKAHQTGSARPWLDRLCGDGTRVVVIQNGVEQLERGRAVVGEATTVVPAVVYCGSELLAPGHVRHHADGTLIVPAGDDADALVELFAETVCTVRPTERWSTAAWRKLGMNVTGNGATALTLRRLDVLRDPAIQALATQVLAECWTVGRAEGAEVDPAEAADAVARMAEHASPTGGTSMYYDRVAGRPLEHDALYGAVVRAAARHGIPVPLHDAFVALLGAAASPAQ